MDKPIPIIHDGDHGGDDLVASLVALDRTDAIELLGITTTFGNVPLEVATKNACRAVDLVGGSEVSVFPGAPSPWKAARRAGDNAFGSNGIGGVELPEPIVTPSSMTALEWFESTLEQAETPVTLCPTGPFTNLARLLEKRPELAAKIERIVGMGGCMHPQPPHGRQGNITPYAEFNFYMDPAAADFVLNCGIPVVLFPLDLTHQLVFSKPRQAQARELLGPGLGEKLVQVMGAAAKLDSGHFKLEGAVFHDECVILYLIEPTLFEGRHLKLEVVTDESSDRYGQLLESRDRRRPEALLVERLLDSDRAFSIILDALRSILGK